jgi:hypothetical protein
MKTTVNTTKLIKMAVATAAIALLAQLQLPAQTWQTVDDFQYTAGKGAIALGAGLDTQGNLYTAGWAYDAANIQHALVMRSSDQGVTWATIEDYNYRPGTNTCFYGFGVDPAQNLYAVGLATMTGTPNHWIVRKSADHGATWTTADDFVPDSGASDGRNVASGVAADGAGNVYVVGMVHQRVGKSSYPYQFWVVRKSGDAGATWTTVDQYGYPNAPESVASAVLATPAGLFVCGLSVATSSRGPQWVVRKSANAGTTWTTVDNFYSSTAFNQPYALTADAAGNVYVGGFSDINATGSYAHYWLVRKGTNGGASWQTVDAFRYFPYPITFAANGALAMGTDALGNVYAVGGGTDANRVCHWVVRATANQGASWVTVDDFEDVSGKSSIPHCFGLDAVGDVYVGGFGRDSANVPHWLLRKATP